MGAIAEGLPPPPPEEDVQEDELISVELKEEEEDEFFEIPPHLRQVRAPNQEEDEGAHADNESDPDVEIVEGPVHGPAPASGEDSGAGLGGGEDSLDRLIDEAFAPVTLNSPVRPPPPAGFVPASRTCGRLFRKETGFYARMNEGEEEEDA